MLDERVNLYLDMYKFELNVRDILNTQISLPIAITTINFGTLTYCIKKLTSITSATPVIPLILAIISTFALLVSIIISVIYIIKGYHNNYIYSHIPSAVTIEEEYTTIRKYYRELNEYNDTNEDYSEKIDESFKLKLIRLYGNCNKDNIGINTIRSAFIFNAKTSVIVGLITNAFAFSFCNYNTISNVTQNCFNLIK